MSTTLDHSEDMYRGAFYIIDNVGQCPMGRTKHDFQYSAIKAHLQRHTYYQRGPEGQVCVGVQKMHSFITALIPHEDLSCDTTKNAYTSSLDESHVDALFRIGTDKLPSQLLASHGYEKSTFREQDLPNYAPPSTPQEPAVSSQFRYIQRSFWIAIQDIDATKHARKHAAYKYRDKDSSLDALHALIRDFNLTRALKTGGIIPCTSKQLCKALLGSWKSQRNADAENLASPWESDSKGWKSDYLVLIRQNCAELTVNKSLPSYHPDDAISLSTDLAREVGHPGKASRNRTADEVSNDKCDDSVIKVHDSKTDTEADYGDGTNNGVQIVRFSNETAAAIASPVPSSPRSESSEPIRVLVKRRRSDERRAITSQAPATPDEISHVISNSDTEASYSTPIDRKRKSIAPSIRSSGKRQRTIGAAQSTPPSCMLPPSEKYQAGVASWVAHHLGNELAENESKSANEAFTMPIPGSSQPLLSGTRDPSSSRLALIALNLSKLEDELKEIYRKLSNASTRLLDGVGDVGQETMPLDPHPTSSALELHVRCWGNEWPHVRAKLRQLRLFSVPDVTLSLSSAYLFNKIFNPPMRGVQVSLEAEGIFASGNIEDVNTMQKIYALIAQDPGYQSSLDRNAIRLSDGLWSAIRPHVKRLEIHAEGLGVLNTGSQAYMDSVWLTTFDPAITAVFQDALCFRMKLMGTDCEYSFTWPHAGQEFDPRTMQTNAGGHLDLAQKRMVAFTLFPGLQVTAADLNNGQAEPVYRAIVKLYPLHASRLLLTA